MLSPFIKVEKKELKNKALPFNKTYRQGNKTTDYDYYCTGGGNYE